MQDRFANSLSPELLAHLADQGELRTYAKNETIITEGDASDALYVLVSGQCKVFTQDERGRELVYNVLEPEDLFGELFLDGGPRSASVRATTVCECIVVGKARTSALVRSHPAFAEFLISRLIERVRQSTQFVRGLALSGVQQRTVALLEREAVLEDGARRVPAGLTQQEIADRVGATREMVNQVIGNLVAEGYLGRDERRRLSIIRSLPAPRREAGH